MAQFIPKQAMTPPIVGGGTDHSSGALRHSTPFASATDLVKGFKSRSPFSKKAGKPTDINSSRALLDQSRVYFPIPFKIPADVDNFTLPESAFLFCIDPAKTIRGTSASIYTMLVLSSVNEMLMRACISHMHTFLTSSSRDMTSTSHTHGIDQVSAPYHDFDPELVNINKIAEKVYFLGFHLSKRTPGTQSSNLISKHTGGDVCTLVHEGRVEAPNVWGDVATGGHVGFAITKFEPIDPSDPFKLRAHQIIPVTCANGVGFGLYPQYGINVHDEDKFNRSAKRSRLDSQVLIGRSMRSTTDTMFIGSYSSSLASGSYHPNSLIAHADEYNSKTVDGTIFSLNRHEVSMNPLQPGFAPEARNVPDTFLDWSVTKFDMKYTNPSGTGLAQGKEVYGANIWSMVMVQAVHLPVGVVWTAGRGGKPIPSGVNDVIFNDHKYENKCTSNLWERNKITLQVRVQN
jgi:hypothetical protein